MARDESPIDLQVERTEWAGKLSQANGESADRRKTIRELEAQLEAFSGLDPEKAKEALEKLDGLDLENLKDADAVKAQIDSIKAAHQGELDKRDDSISAKDNTIRKLVVSNAFASSPLFTDPKRSLMTPDVAEKLFGDRFTVDENGKAVCYEGEKPMYSPKTGELASFDEAIDLLWDAYPHKDRYTPANKPGDQKSGGERNEPGGNGNIKTLKDFKTPAEKAAYIGKYGREAFEDLPLK
jgi:DNA-directed RNA polymerase subunit F